MANHSARKTLSTVLVYTKFIYLLPGFLKTGLAKNQFFLYISYDQSQASNGFFHLSGKNCIVSCFLVRALAKSEKVLKSSAGFIDIIINKEIYRESRKREKKNTHTKKTDLNDD